MMITVHAINRQLQSLQSKNTSRKLLVAYSGGLDSHVLLNLASQLPDWDVRAMHVHHGLQAAADGWVNHCQNICGELNVPLKIAYLNLVVNSGESIENEARKGRYQALRDSLLEDEILLTAHHQDDQAETLLLQLFRGSGVQGLASMPIVKEFGKGLIVRPLLGQSREELEQYAANHQLDIIDDPSNLDQTFDRNFLRQNIIPQLATRWLGINKTLSRAASIQAETKDLLDEIAAKDLCFTLNDEIDALSIAKLLSLSKARQKLLLRYWIVKNGFSAPSEIKLKHIFIDVVNARKDSQPLLEWSGVQLRRYKNHLYIMPPLSDHDSQQAISWSGTNSLKIESLDLVLLPEYLNNNLTNITIRFRQGGESLYVQKRNAHISLKNLLNEYNVPPWMRERVPLIFEGEELIQVLWGIK